MDKCVDSYFPQLKDGVIEPYVPVSVGILYTDYNQYAVEMIQNIAIPADHHLIFGNHDDIIQNHLDKFLTTSKHDDYPFCYILDKVI